MPPEDLPSAGTGAVPPGSLDQAGQTGPVEVVDHRPRRVRRQVDILRLVSLVLLVSALAVIGAVADDTTEGANHDLSRLMQEPPELLIRALSLLGTFGVLVLPVALAIREIVRDQTRRLMEALGTGLLALVAVALLDLAITANVSGPLRAALVEVGSRDDVRPLDAYLAAIFAFVVVIGLMAEPGWRGVFWIAIGVYVVSAFGAGQASLISLIASPSIGAIVGLAVRYIAGSINERPDAARVAGQMRPRGLSVVRMERLGAPTETLRMYCATTDTGRRLTVYLLDRDLIASGAVYGIYRRLRIRATLASAPPLSLERVADRRSLLAYGAKDAGAQVPEFVGGVPCGPDAIALIYEEAPVSALEDPTDEQLLDLWTSVGRLHRDRITHRGITAASLGVDTEGRVVLPILVGGTMFASDLRISLDRAAVLMATAQLVGAQRAVAVARLALRDADLAAAMPLLQPIALPRGTRSALKADTALLEDVRERIHSQIPLAPPAPDRIERFRPRVIISIVAIIVAGYLIVGQLGSLDVATVLSSADWGWVPFVLAASVATYFAAALSLTGYVQERLSFGRTVLVQVAASFVGFVTPPAVGGLAVNLRYLRKAKLSATSAATSVGMSQAINATSHAALLVVFAAATGAESKASLPIPGWAFIALGILVVLALVLLAVPTTRQWTLARILPPLREALPRLLSLMSNPIKLTEAIGGALLLNIANIAALWFAVRAFGGDLTLAAVAVVYLAGAAVASVAPTPGGLGAVEIALSTGLAAASMPSAPAVSAVLLFRLATFWLPVPIGWGALHILQRRGAL